ncbi:SMI1/KNR4 family protein [Streptomyces cavernicola]|uniref:SMI1/KNR4 family protein n=1 Tax=Streptomyces cavernicola TaxID=3043613 RepID=A0ABT6S822_9ACTN|nr:SMI1/KNR4 family protein [Streptomyces sp. B-S-A6]MDI3404230.1 SMI1/KNR4 family protein [Streptomyces sp. B-S-A6]
MSCEETFPAAPPSRLTELEQRIGAKLPDAYRAYLGTQDGGAPGGYNHVGIEVIFGVGEVPGWASLWRFLDSSGDVIPDGSIPVGADGGGGLFLLAVTGTDRGSVWYQSGELEEDDSGAVLPVVRERLADTWGEFLASIGPLEDRRP